MTGPTPAANRPVIIGAAQEITPPRRLPGPEPLAAWKQVALAAASDARITAAQLAEADSISVIDCMSWRYDDPVARLAESLGAHPRTTDYTDPSGASGHKALQAAAAAIRVGTSELALIVGGESLATLRRYRAEGRAPAWEMRASPSEGFDLDEHQHPDEVAVGLTADVGAVYSFAMRDIARRAHLGVAPEDYRAHNARLFSEMSQVAAANRYAWFPTCKSPDFIGEPRSDNRWISYPYTKHSVAMIDVDLAGALIVTSEERARAWGIPESLWIHPWAAALLRDPAYIAVRENLWESPAMKAAARAVLQAHDQDPNELECIDLYSCFPAAVNFGQDALGTDLPGNRVTVTGGLPYAGGPGSSYMLNSLAMLVHRLRDSDGGVGLASGVGMLMSEHAYGLYGRAPVADERIDVHEAELQSRLDAASQRRIDSSISGLVRVVTYTVMHGRDGLATHSAAICEAPDGTRAYASLAPDLLETAEQVELVGETLVLDHSYAGTIGVLLST